MKIAILGGGITGLTAAYYLAKKNHQVTLFEKEKILGGLAAGFKTNNWDWYLERAYHHLFANDYDILNFAKEIGFNKIFFRFPETASLFNNGTILPLDTPLDFLRFPYLNIVDKLRAGIVIVFLKLSPFLSIYEKQTSQEFLKKTMGEKVWNILWQPLFRGKYGDYAGNIMASFIWARIKKRTKNLGYIEGGFQTLIDYVENKLKHLNVKILKNTSVEEIRKNKTKFNLTYTGRPSRICKEDFDLVISTLPTPILSKLTANIFTSEYLSQFNKLKYLHAITLILETDKPILDKTYWLNISTPKIPIMGIVQHTNFIDKKNYGNKHIAYLGWYLKRDDKLMKMKDRELLNYVSPYLKQISDFGFRISDFYVFRAPFAQPIFDKNFVKNKPDFITPVKNFFISNLDMTYPYDRGTNYAVKLGKEVTKLI
ncbi:FAD-dependent oxidoreductase [Candidatus Roizmanbacteria bacterium]|nr:FAD-dependent oxidoreductase [Candidatus Roizmanbacteria bacterium]